MLKKSLLILSDWYLPGYKAGGPITSIYNLTSLLHKDFDISIITSDRDFGDTNHYENISIGEWTHQECIRVYYIPKSKNFLSSLYSLLREQKYDVIYLNSMWSLRFTILPLICIQFILPSKVVLAPRGMLQEGAMKFKTKKKRLFVKILKFFGLLNSVIFHATDDQEVNDIVQLFDKTTVIALSNVPSSIAIRPKFILKLSGEVKLIFLSRVSEKKNLLGLLNILLKVKVVGFIDLSIYGQIESSEYWDKCLSLISQMPSNISVSYLNSLQKEKVRDAMEEHHFFILPTFGENFGHAIYESLSVGRPVIISDKTPWRDLQVSKVGYDIPLSDIVMWTKTIEDVAAMNQVEYDIYSKASHTYAKAFAEKEDLKSQYIKLFNQ